MEVELRRAIKRRFLYTCMWLIIAAGPVAFAQEPSEDEALIKAAFIYNFAKFTQWPEGSFNETITPLTLCTSGKDELTETLQRIGDRRIKGRPVTTLPIKQGKTLEQCHLLYIARSENGLFAENLARVRKKPVLSVSEINGFAQAGGIIQLVHKNERIRFIINLENAREAGLKLSSKLLRLAVVVNSGEAK